MTVVRAALVQTTWTGDKESMIDKHEEYAREAAAQGAQVICFQELFYGPYFCQVQDSQFYEYAEAVPGPTTERFQALAKELGMVIVLPVYERSSRFLYNTAAVIDADGTYLGKYRKHAHPARAAASGRSSTSGRATSGTPSSTPPSARSASTSATTGTSPRAGARSASTVPRSCSTPAPPAAACPSTSGRSSSRPPPWPTSTSSAPSTGSASRTSATTTSTATSYFVDPEGKFVGDGATRTSRSSSCATSTST